MFTRAYLPRCLEANSQTRGLSRNVLLLLVQGFYLLAIMLVSPSSHAQISAGGLRTRVNGTAYGQCSVGTCSVSGGIGSGPNLFQRFSHFDTRNGIKEVRVHTQGKRNLILGVTNPNGTFINQPLIFSSQTNLYWLSPRGIWIGEGAKFLNAPNLLLSTGRRLRIGSFHFDVFQSEAADITRQDDQPSPIASGRHSDGHMVSKSIESSGDGSITFAGGLITVERNLLVDARGGDVSSQPGKKTSLQAGHSVLIAGKQIDLKDAQINAGHAGELGLVDIQTSSEGTQAGEISMNHTNIHGQQILISAGQAIVQNSDLRAPNGKIQILSVNSPEQGNAIRITNSRLDVGIHRINDLAKLSLESASKGDAQRDYKSRTSASIDLISNGNIDIESSTLSTTSDLSSLKHIPVSTAGWLVDSLPARTGQIFLDAKGHIDIRSSRITADASHNLAGQIGLRAMQEAPGGGVSIKNSTLSASFGLGKGEITVFSRNGISISDSTFITSNDHYPIVNGSTLATIPQSKTQQPLPLSFFTGKIWLFNLSSTEPISIYNSSFMARQTTSGGPLESKFFTGLRKLFSDDEKKFIGYGGKFKGVNAFKLDYDFYDSGGVVEIISTGGINIKKSKLDVSSRDERSQVAEATSGRIGIINTGDSDLSLHDSNLSAVSGFAKSQGISRLLAGYITLGNKGRILLAKTAIDARNFNAGKSFDQTEYSYPYLDIFTFSTLSMDPETSLNASVESNLNHHQVNRQGLIELYQPSPHPIDIQNVKPSPHLLGGADRDHNELMDYLDHYYSFVTQKAETSLLRTFVQDKNIFNPTQTISPNLQPFNLFPHIRAYAISSSQETPIEIEQGDLRRDFLHAQEKSMRETMKNLGLSDKHIKPRSIKDLQQILVQSRTLSYPSNKQLNTYSSSAQDDSQDFYNPAIIRLQKDEQPSGMIRITAILMAAEGEPFSRSFDVPRPDLNHWIKTFQRRLSRRESIQTEHRQGQTSKMFAGLLESLLPTLRHQRITALLLEADRGLQAIPYGFLPLAGRPLSETFALTITPSLGLIDLDPTRRGQRDGDGQMLLAGASAFRNGLDPLPMVRQELSTLAAEHPATLLLDEAFTPSALLEKARTERVRQLHIASHANFQPGQISTGVLFTPTTSVSLADLGRGLRSRDSARPLDLISLSGCVTALGDEQSELGFVGMALQAGARSGLGTLWEVDDAATAAFFIQFYRYSKQGLSKDQALQATQRAFLRREVRLEGEQLVGPDPAGPAGGGARATLVSGLSREQQTLFGQGLDHPYFWAGMVLSGSPW